MTCFGTSAIGYLPEKFQIDLSVPPKDQHYAFGVG